jgi:hypothetical protein
MLSSCLHQQTRRKREARDGLARGVWVVGGQCLVDSGGRALCIALEAPAETHQPLPLLLRCFPSIPVDWALMWRHLMWRHTSAPSLPQYHTMSPISKPRPLMWRHISPRTLPQEQLFLFRGTLVPLFYVTCLSLVLYCETIQERMLVNEDGTLSTIPIVIDATL